MDDKTPFVVDSLPVAAALLASGIHVKTVQRVGVYRCSFHCTPADKARTLASQFLTEQLCPPAVRVFQAFEDLRSQVKRGGAA